MAHDGIPATAEGTVCQDGRSGKGLTSFALKIIAIIAMTCNHASYIFEPLLSLPALCVLNGVGGITFPVMAFLLTEGYRHTRDVRRYMLRLLIFALIAQIPYYLYLAYMPNVMFTLFLGLALLYLNDRMKNRVLFGAVFAVLLMLNLLCDWGGIGLVMIFIMGTFEGKKRLAYPTLIAIAYLILSGAMLIPLGDQLAIPTIIYGVVGCGSAYLLLSRYNGQRGKPLKYFFYAYYPAHILVLGLIATALP